MAFNQTLKFSWGHVIAFVAMIFISYVSFMGITYFTDGNFIVAGLGVIVVNLVLAVFFILPQILKGTDKKFKKKIVYERLLFFTAPFFFAVAMFAFAHFWTVFENRKKVETTFSSAITTTKGMFESYDIYASNRIKEYDNKLAKDKVSKISRTNAVEALKLQIWEANYDELKQSAFNWIDNASGATIWNVFMIGNRKKIEDAIEDWNASLTAFSSKIMTNELQTVKPFTSSDPSVIAAKMTLANVKGLYTSLGTAPTGKAVLTALVLYLLLMFPYIIQRRNTKSEFKLIGKESHVSAFEIGNVKRGSANKGTISKEKKYESFTL